MQKRNSKKENRKGKIKNGVCNKRAAAIAVRDLSAGTMASGRTKKVT
jgi:hypothetical protein